MSRVKKNSKRTNRRSKRKNNRRSIRKNNRRSIRKNNRRSIRKNNRRMIGGALNPHIMYRFLSGEDRSALNDINTYGEPISFTFPYSNIEKQPYKVYTAGMQFKRLLSGIPHIKERLDLKLQELKRQKLATPIRNQKYNDEIVQILKENLREDDFLFQVNVYPAYYPIRSDNLMNQSVPVHRYLTDHAWDGIRRTHGIHGFFTYDVSKVESGWTSRPNFYEKFGYWFDERPKDMFITKFTSDETGPGNLSSGTFNEIFSNITTDEKLEPLFVDCREGGVSAKGENPTGTENEMVTLGKDATCDSFEVIPNGDQIKYARLGRLMPDLPSGIHEVNFRGSGKISGYHVKLKEYDIILSENISSEFRPIAEYIRGQILEFIQFWNTDKNMELHKLFFGEVHSNLIKGFETDKY